MNNRSYITPTTFPSIPTKNRYDYVRDITGDSFTFSDILNKCYENYSNNKIVYSYNLHKERVEQELRMEIALLIHTFYPFVPVSDARNEIDINVESSIRINLYSYQQFLQDIWYKDLIIKELRYKKLKRIIK